MDHCWRCSPELLHSMHPIGEGNDNKNIPRTVTGLLFRVYTKDYAIVFLTGALMIGNVSIRGTYKTVCLIPYTLHFLYITERTGTKGFARRFSFISLMEFSQSMHIKNCKSCTENII